jgi:hypothetical protein
LTLEDLAARVPNFAGLIHAERIKLLIWWLQAFGQKQHVLPRDVTTCYSSLSISPPANINSFFNAMERRTPKQLLKSSAGYKLERTLYDALTQKYGQRPAAVHVEKLLADLPKKIPDLMERDYLAETIICLRSGAFRATVVMAWNLAYDHVCEWIVGDALRLTEFNAQAPRSFPRAGYPVISKRDDFLEFKESHVLQIAKSARLITDSQHKVLKEKLDRRNVAAHPSGIKILQQTAEEVIRDLIENVVLKLP